MDTSETQDAELILLGVSGCSNTSFRSTQGHTRKGMILALCSFRWYHLGTDTRHGAMKLLMVF